MRFRRSAAWAAAGLGLLACTLGCSGIVDPVEAGLTSKDLGLSFSLPWDPSPLPLEQDLSEAGALAAATLTKRITDSRFPEDLIACDEHADRFTWLAARAEDREVIAAALYAMEACEQEVHPTDATTVAAHRLFHPDREVVGGALAVAEPRIGPLAVDHPLVSAMVRVAREHDDMGTRIAALEVLDKRVWTQEPTVIDAFYDALMASRLPSLTAMSLEIVTYRSGGLQPADQHRFRVAAMVLAADIDPGIRGYSAYLLARLNPRDEEIQSRLIGLLEDKHAYTRSAAADALSDMGYLPAIHEFMFRLRDAEPNVWRMLPFERPDGTTDRMVFVGSHFERANDAYLRALEHLTSNLETPFVYREIDPRYRDLDILAAGRDALKWYEAHKDTLPVRGVADAASTGQADAAPEAEEEG